MSAALPPCPSCEKLRAQLATEHSRGAAVVAAAEALIGQVVAHHNELLGLLPRGMTLTNLFIRHDATDTSDLIAALDAWHGGEE